jgi:hypothetical protein
VHEAFFCLLGFLERNRIAGTADYVSLEQPFGKA